MFKGEYIFAIISAPFILGICTLYFFPQKELIAVLAILAAILFSYILFVGFTYRSLNGYRFKGLTGIFILLFFFVFGGLLCLLNSDKLKTDYFAKEKYTYLKIIVNDEPSQTNDILRFKAKVIGGYKKKLQHKVSGQLLVALKLDSINPVTIKYGDELVVSAEYLEVEPPYNPAEFDFKSWLAGQNIYQQTFINQNHLLKTNENAGNPIIKSALNLREKQIAKYRKLIKNHEAFSVASTLILGYRADLSKETLAAYSKTGTIHALSVSGSHVAIIFLVLDFLLLFLDKNKFLKVFKFILICSLIWGYALITGLSPSVIRSAIMITIFITGKTFSKTKNGYNTLAFAAFCQLVYNPFLTFDVGFQLSYISVFGLIYLQPKISRLIYVKNKYLNQVWELIALSLAAQVVTFPLCLYYFHQFPIYFLIGNLFISIPLFIIMILGIFILIPYLDFLAPVFEWIIVFTNHVLKWIANLPFSTISSIWINQTELFLLIVALCLLLYPLNKFNTKQYSAEKIRQHRRILMLSLVTYMGYSSLRLYNDWKIIHQQKIIFFSLRKNYAAAFIKGSKAILLTDLQTDDKNYQFFVKPALEQAQINQIDYVSLNRDTIIQNFILRDKQIIFASYKILCIDETLNYKKLKTNAHFSSLWITGNTKFKLENLPQELRFENIIIDAKNKDYKISIFKTYADKIKKECYILKKNPAYLVQLTQ